MTIPYLEGFDRYNGIARAGGGAELAWQWQIGSGGNPNVEFQIVAGRFGGNALRIFKDVASGANINPPWLRKFFPAASSYAFGVAIRVVQPQITGTGTDSNGYDFIVLDSTGNPHLGFKYLVAGTLEIRRLSGATLPQNRTSGTVLATIAASNFVAGVYHYLEVAGTIADSGGVLTVRVNGTQVFTSAALDTRNAGLADAGGFHFSAYPSQNFAWQVVDIQYDDFYFRTGTQTFLGEGKITTLRPTADTGVKMMVASSGSDNFAMVDENPYSLSDFVSGTSVGNSDLYVMEDLAATPTSIAAVAVQLVARKTDSATRTIEARVLSGPSDTNGTPFTLNSDATLHQRGMLLNPNGSIAWTGSAVNALQVGPRVAS